MHSVPYMSSSSKSFWQECLRSEAFCYCHNDESLPSSSPSRNLSIFKSNLSSLTYLCIDICYHGAVCELAGQILLQITMKNLHHTLPIVLVRGVVLSGEQNLSPFHSVLYLQLQVFRKCLPLWAHMGGFAESVPLSRL